MNETDIKIEMLRMRLKYLSNAKDTFNYQYYEKQLNKLLNQKENGTH